MIPKPQKSFHDNLYFQMEICSFRKSCPSSTIMCLYFQLALIDWHWMNVFKRKMSIDQKTWAKELQGVRNKWAHIGGTDFDESYTLARAGHDEPLHGAAGRGRARRRSGNFCARCATAPRRVPPPQPPSQQSRHRNPQDHEIGRRSGQVAHSGPARPGGW